MKKIRVLIVDDSALIRQILTSALNMVDDIEVVGTAIDPFEARDKIKQLHPDVLTLDVEMPKMDGIAFLENLMRLRPMPVVMVSTLTTKSSNVTLRALELGAIDFIAKPSASLQGDISGFALEVQEKIRLASKANVVGFSMPRSMSKPRSITESSVGKNPTENKASTVDRFTHIIAIGASTGGTEAIKVVLQDLPADSPPVLIVQHIPESFSASFANRLNDCCQMTVVEARNNQAIVRGTAYVAPGDKHILLAGIPGSYRCRLEDTPKVNRHRPAVDVMFNSLLSKLQPNEIIAVILTGMGADGASGLKNLHDKGVYTLVQNEASSVVWGMPGSAVKLDAVDEVLPLTKIARKLLRVPLRRGSMQARS